MKKVRRGRKESAVVKGLKQALPNESTAGVYRGAGSARRTRSRQCSNS